MPTLSRHCTAWRKYLQVGSGAGPHLIARRSGWLMSPREHDHLAFLNPTLFGFISRPGWTEFFAKMLTFANPTARPAVHLQQVLARHCPTLIVWGLDSIINFFLGAFLAVIWQLNRWTNFCFLTLKSDLKDQWHLRHLVRLIRKHDLISFLTILSILNNFWKS